MGPALALMMIQLLASVYVARLSRGHRLATEYLGVEAAGTFDVRGHDEVGQHDLVCR